MIQNDLNVIFLPFSLSPSRWAICVTLVSVKVGPHFHDFESVE